MTNEIAIQEKYDGLLTQLKNTSGAEQLNYFNQLEANLVELQNTKEVIELAEGRIYYEIQKLWKDDKLSPIITAQYEHGFYRWAVKSSLKGRHQISKTNVQNKIRVYRAWFSDEKTIAPPPEVYDENENELEFDLNNIPYSKLLLATGAGVAGDLDEDCWYGLASPDIDTDELTRRIRKSKANVNGNDSTNDNNGTYIFREGGLVYISDNHFATPFLRILYENNDKPLFQKAIETFLHNYELPLDPDYYEGDEEKDNGNLPTLRQDENGVEISFNGSYFNFTLDEAQILSKLLWEVNYD
jgi:hypothetical protein